MILVDTSVWVRAFAYKQPYRDELDELLENETVVRHDLVHGELLIGDPAGREKPLATYLSFTRVDTVPHDEVVELVRRRKLHGTGIGWIDAHLLAAALAERVQIFTADHALQEQARRLGVLYEPPER